jgi:hypothetical protein
MERDFRKGHLEVDFPAPPFVASMPVLRETFRLFFANFQFLALVTLGISIPGELAIQFLAYLLGIPHDGIWAYVLLAAGELLLGSLFVPAIVYGLVQHLRGDAPDAGQALRWGRRQWLRILGNDVRVEITVGLYLLLLVIPGIIASLRLAYVESIVGIEGDTQPSPLSRSGELTKGRLWRIFWVMLPLGLLDALANYVLVDRMPAIANSRPLFAIAQSLVAMVAQLTTIACLLMYLGSIPPGAARIETPRVAGGD